MLGAVEVLSAGGGGGGAGGGASWKVLRGGEGAVLGAPRDRRSAAELVGTAIGWDSVGAAPAPPKAPPAPFPEAAADCVHGGVFYTLPVVGGSGGEGASSASENGGRCECAPLFSGRRCEKPPPGDAGSAEALLAGVEWRMPTGQPLVLHRDAPRHRGDEGGEGGEETRGSIFLTLDLRAVLPEAPDGDAFAAARAPGARARCAVLGSGTSAEGPAAFVEAQALDLVVRQLGAGGAVDGALAADVAAVGPAWVDAFLLAGGGSPKGGTGGGGPQKLWLFPEEDGYTRKHQERWVEAMRRLAADNPPRTLLVASEEFTRHAVAVRARLVQNAAGLGVGDLPPAPKGALDFKLLLFSLQGCARVHVFGSPPFVAVAGGGSMGRASGAAGHPPPDPATPAAALLAQVGTGVVKAASGDLAAPPPLDVYTMYSPKYEPYFRNLQRTFTAQGGAGWALHGVEVADEKFNLAKGTNKLRGSSRRLRLLLAELKRRLSSADPHFCWMDTTTLVADELLWRPYTGKDLYLPPESRFGNPTQAANMCFMCLRANERTLSFFSRVLQDVEEANEWEQDRVNVRLAEGYASLEWDWIPTSVVDIMAARHDDCTTWRSAAVLKFISMATKKEAYPAPRTNLGKLYHSYMDLVLGRREECPPELEDRAEKKWAKLVKTRKRAKSKENPDERELVEAAQLEEGRRTGEEGHRKRVAREKRRHQREQRKE